MKNGNGEFFQLKEKIFLKRKNYSKKISNHHKRMKILNHEKLFVRKFKSS